MRKKNLNIFLIFVVFQSLSMIFPPSYKYNGIREKSRFPHNS
jgi:hypothetical protein